ncbi:ATP-binding protein [Bacillus sp. REN3]|uniref:sensor histidine kinase n=1 Tax=Bacillus sp. REN3 TaxID=2802440 RepID=UPI001AEE1C28|nr:ATP-binding protein [Bacillus sp. REN3]
MRRIKALANLLLSKLIAVNSVIILLVILLAGISVKDYACYLVNNEQVTGPQLVDTLNSFLVKVSFIAFITAGLVHFFSVKRIVKPVKTVTNAANQIREGKIPSRIDTAAKGELGELVANFNAMAETLSVVQARREEMLRDIAHELRTPLTNINGYLEALQNGVLKGDRELFASLLEESRRITRIVDLISELDAWNKDVYFLEKQFVEVEIADVLQEAIAAFQLKLSNRFDSFKLEIKPGIIHGHKDGVKQVLSNLLQNIIDYDIGGHLGIAAGPEGKSFMITFTHEGMYIDPDKSDLIFGRFYRLEESRSTKVDGAGLGLAIAKSIVEAHEGEIELATNGHDHTFTIKFPLYSAS